MAFDQATRNRLQKFVGDARKLLSEEFTQQLQNTYGLDPVTGGIAELSSLPALSPSEQQTATLLRDTLEHYLAASHKAEPHKDKTLVIAALDRIVREQAFTVLNRLAALRMAEARQFMMESISQGYQSKGFQLYQRIAGSGLGETGQAYQHYLFSVFDELSLDLAVLFDRYSGQGRLFPRETVLLELLDLINDSELEILWGEDETVGWIYQYFNSKEERKKMRDESQAPRNSRELAVRNQFFTPRYVVEYLTDNTLGKIWYEMTQGNTKLVDSCEYLVRRPNDIFLKDEELAPEQDGRDTAELSQEDLLQQTVYIQHRPIKDPRDIKMLDPACGSMHFGLYAFDLFEQIYSEAWDVEAEKGTAIFFNEEGVVPRAALHVTYPSKEDFLADVPRLIIEHNIHGVDIDPRAAQIAGLSLWLRAQKSWSNNAIQPNQRPPIQRSNIVCAEPMPGETKLLKEFTSQIQPRVLGQLVEEIFDKMQFAGEAGTLLKIEEEIQSAIEEAKSQKDENALEVQGGLFGGDKWEVREGKRYYNFGDVGDEFWGKAEQLILHQLQLYAENASGQGHGQTRLFAEDAAKGFAFIDLCRKRFDVVLMNPPFGEAGSSVSSYFDDNYRAWNKNILCAFIARSKLLSSNGYVGSVIDRSLLNKSTYDQFRKVNFLDRGCIDSVLDLGWGVLDGANVEVASFTLNCSSAARGSKNTDFFDLRNYELSMKEEELGRSLSDISESGNWSRHRTSVFESFPNSALIYDLPDSLLRTFDRFQGFGASGYSAYTGHQLQSERHFLLHWEISREKGMSPAGPYERLYNGGEYSRYVSSPKEVVLFGYFSDLKPKDVTNYTYVLRNKEHQKKSGVNFGVRGEYLDAHLGSPGRIFTVEGQSIPCDTYSDALYVTGILNSMIASRLLNTFSGQHKYSGYVNLLPFPIVDREVKQRISRSVEEIVDIKLKYYSYDEASEVFRRPFWLDVIDSSDSTSRVLAIVEKDQCKLDNLANQINSEVNRAYGIVDVNGVKDLDSYIAGYQNDKTLLKELTNGFPVDQFLRFDIVLFSLGLEFGEWSLDFLSDRKHTLSAEEYFSEEIPGRISVNVDRREVFDSESLIKNIQEKYNESDDLFAAANISQDDLGVYLSGECSVFKYQLKKYAVGRRQAPIYWPLQTRTGSYTLWIYYHSLNEQTLYTCVNNFVEPKLKGVTDELDILRNKPSRNRQEEKELVLLGDLEVELKDFSDQLLLIAKFWKPNLNDGVQISAAPLWMFFQHSVWRKKLKKAWEKLECGDCDWSNLACSIWPKRVLRKCHKDRSLAIAHGVESDLWQEQVVPAARGKGTKLVWQPKKMIEAELEAYIENKIEQDRSLR